MDKKTQALLEWLRKCRDAHAQWEGAVHRQAFKEYNEAIETVMALNANKERYRRALVRAKKLLCLWCKKGIPLLKGEDGALAELYIVPEGKHSRPGRCQALTVRRTLERKE